MAWYTGGGWWARTTLRQHVDWLTPCTCQSNKPEELRFPKIWDVVVSLAHQQILHVQIHVRSKVQKTVGG